MSGLRAAGRFTPAANGGVALALNPRREPEDRGRETRTPPLSRSSCSCAQDGAVKRGINGWQCAREESLWAHRWKEQGSA